jgi:hypothetical protein
MALSVTLFWTTEPSGEIISTVFSQEGEPGGAPCARAAPLPIAVSRAAAITVFLI